MFKHTISTTYSTDAGIIVQVPETITGSTSRDIDSVLGPTGTATYDVTLTLAVVQSLLMYADQPVTVTTGEVGAPVDTINLKQNIPLTWTINSWNPIPLVGDVTKLNVTNNGPVEATVKIRVLTN
jgi:hypothetical protein